MNSSDIYFIETSGFTEWVADQSADWDATYSELQRDLASNPESGKVMKGCGGLRKLRVRQKKRGKGKRGGARVIYLQVLEANCICMIQVYGKDEKDDLTPDDRRAFAEAAKLVRAKALEVAGIADENED